MYRLFLVFLLVFAFTGTSLAADATAFNPTTVTVTAKSSGGGVPVGTIVAWPVAKNPSDWSNWLECNGQTITQKAYPELYAMIGAYVPDLRGLFLRGVGGNSAALGVLQAESLLDHVHGVGYIVNGAGYHTPGWGAFNPWDGSGYSGFGAKYSGTPVISGGENRPVNRAVRYLIRAKP